MGGYVGLVTFLPRTLTTSFKNVCLPLTGRIGLMLSQRWFSRSLGEKNNSFSWTRFTYWRSEGAFVQFLKLRKPLKPILICKFLDVLDTQTTRGLQKEKVAHRFYGINLMEFSFDITLSKLKFKNLLKISVKKEYKSEQDVIILTLKSIGVIQLHSVFNYTYSLTILFNDFPQRLNSIQIISNPHFKSHQKVSFNFLFSKLCLFTLL